MSEGTAVPIVVDTNVLVTSIYGVKNIHRYLVTGELVLIWNNQTHAEAVRIVHKLWKKHYSKYGANGLSEAIAVLELISELGIKVQDMPDDWPRVSRDPDDDMFLFVAEVGQAEYVVTEDKGHLLSLGSFKDIPIGTPQDLFSWLEIAHPLPAG